MIMGTCRLLLEEFGKCQKNSSYSTDPTFCDKEKIAYGKCVEKANLNYAKVSREKENQHHRYGMFEDQKPGSLGISTSGRVGFQVGGGLMLDTNGKVGLSVI